MTTKRSVIKTGLQGFKSWLAEHFPGRRLEVSHTREGDQYACSLKLRGVLIAKGLGITQKSSADEAAAQARERCNGDPASLRDILRTQSSQELSPALPQLDQPVPTQANSDLPESKRLRKQLAQQTKSLEEAVKQIEGQARDIKRLNREVSEMANLNLAHKLDQLTTETARLRAAMAPLLTQENKVELHQSKILQLESCLQNALEDIKLCLSRSQKPPASKSQAPPVASSDLVQALQDWAPPWSGLAGPTLAALLACKTLIVPNLAVARACYQAFNPYADMAVFYVEPGWVSSRQALSPQLLQQLTLAVKQPESLRLLVFEGLGTSGLQTWGRSLCHWAQGLQTYLSEWPGQPWPRNLRLVFVPRKQPQSASPVSSLAAVPAHPDPCADKFGAIDWHNFLDTCWDSQALEPRATRQRIQTALKLLAPAIDAANWTENLLARWPDTYRKQDWWVV